METTKIDSECALQVKVLKYFEKMQPVDTNITKYKCKIDKCNRNLSGKQHSNLLKHVRRMHANFFETNIQKKIRPLTLVQKRMKFIQNSVEIVTMNGRSFLHLNDSGYKKQIDEKLDELVTAGLSEGLTGPNFTAIKKRIAYLAEQIKMQIEEEVKDRFVALMIDFATKNNRSFMGVSLQYVCNGRIEERSIGILEMNSSHTSRHILAVLIDLLNSFGIEKSRVLSVTTDNAPNLTLMVKLLNEQVDRELADAKEDTDFDEVHAVDEGASQRSDQDLEENVFAQPNPTHEFFTAENIEAEILKALTDLDNQPDTSNEDSDEELNDMLNDDADFANLIEALENDFALDTLIANGIRCAAHTLQLAVIDAINDRSLNVKNVITLCRIVCKMLRKQSTINMLEENGIIIKSPRLDCLTRWSSTYLMVSIQRININGNNIV